MWASYHAYSLIVTMLATHAEHSSSQALFFAAVLRALQYRFALVASLECLTRRWSAASTSSPLAAHAALLHHLSALADSLLPVSVIFALLAYANTDEAMLSSSSLETLPRTSAAAELTALAIQRLQSLLSTSAPGALHHDAAPPHHTWSFVRFFFVCFRATHYFPGTCFCCSCNEPPVPARHSRSAGSHASL